MDRESPLIIKAVETGDLEAVKVFLRYGMDPDTRDEYGNTALMKACRLGSMSKFALHKCTEKTANVVKECIVSDEKARSALNAIENAPAIAKLLLDYGADINARNRWDMTALLCASSVWDSSPNALEEALKKNFSPVKGVYFADNLLSFKNCHHKIRNAGKNSYVIIDSRFIFDLHEIFGDTEVMFIPVNPSEESVKIVRLLINSGTDMRVRDGEGKNALRLAVENRAHPGVISALIDAGCDIETGSEGVSAFIDANHYIEKMDLEYAIKYNSPELVHTLLMNRADPEAVCRDGKELLIFYAAKNSSAEVIRELILFGAYVDTKLDSGTTPLMVAAAYNTLSVVEVLLSEGADVNAKDQIGRTALRAAVNNNHHGIVRRLLEAGADPNVRTQEKESFGGQGTCHTPLLLASWGNELGCSYKIIKELLEHGAEPDARDLDENRNALMYMAWNPDRSPEMAKLLAEAGTDVNGRDIVGSTPLKYLTENNLSEKDRPIVDMLISQGADPYASNKFGHMAWV